jgi:ABC-2 type transport system permease protein
MKKYLQVLSVGIQNTLAYRLNFFFRAGFNLVPLAATIFLWRTIYASKAADSDVAGYELAQMISYYLVVSIVDALTAVNEDDWQIAAEIRDGQISQFLLKPINYFAYRMVLYAAGRIVYLVTCFVPLGLFILYYQEYFHIPSDPSVYLWFSFSVVLTALLQFFISFTMALLAFWILEIDTFIFILFAIEYVAGGHLFPLDILPPWINALLVYTPFPYLLYFPVSIFIERTTGSMLSTGIAIQIFWVCAAFFLARFVWNRGIRKYSAVGG